MGSFQIQVFRALCDLSKETLIKTNCRVFHKYRILWQCPSRASCCPETAFQKGINSKASAANSACWVSHGQLEATVRCWDRYDPRISARLGASGSHRGVGQWLQLQDFSTAGWCWPVLSHCQPVAIVHSASCFPPWGHPLGLENRRG